MSSDAPRTLAELMAHALAMELEAVQRYGEFADVMQTHNNRDVAALFRTMAQHEAEHVRRVMDEMDWQEIGDAPRVRAHWPGFEAPGTVPVDELHYLMQPWHALQLALAAEQRAERFYAELCETASDPDMRRAAHTLRAEEAEHVRLIEQWLARVPQPDADWETDPDPPRYVD